MAFDPIRLTEAMHSSWLYRTSIYMKAPAHNIYIFQKEYNVIKVIFQPNALKKPK